MSNWTDNEDIQEVFADSYSLQQIRQLADDRYGGNFERAIAAVICAGINVLNAPEPLVIATSPTPPMEEIRRLQRQSLWYGDKFAPVFGQSEAPSS